MCHDVLSRGFTSPCGSLYVVCLLTSFCAGELVPPGTLRTEPVAAQTSSNPGTYAHPEVLVETDWVKENVGKPGIHLVEIDGESKVYDAGHIRGAVKFNWETQLQDQLRRDILNKEAFEKLVGDAGILAEDTVILYGDSNNWFAAYGFWLFKIYGHKDVRLMNGGRVKWLNEPDKEFTTDLPQITPTTYRASMVNIDLRARLQQVMKASLSGQHALVDVRSPDEFTGKVIAPAGTSAQTTCGSIARRSDSRRSSPFADRGPSP